MYVRVSCCQGYGIFSRKSGNVRVSTSNFESESFDFSVVIKRRIGNFSRKLVAGNCMHEFTDHFGKIEKWQIKDDYAK